MISHRTLHRPVRLTVALVRMWHGQPEWLAPEFVDS